MALTVQAFRSFIPGFRLVDGTKFNNLFGGKESFSPSVANMNQVVGGTTTSAPTLLTAAGATQGNAAPVTASMNFITVATTASTHGVRLPTAATGLQVTIANNGTFGVKVYPATNGKIGAASTNASDTTVLAVNKVNTYFALNGTYWAVQRGS